MSNRRRRQTGLEQNEVEKMMAEFPFSHPDKDKFVCLHAVHANPNTAMSMHNYVLNLRARTSKAYGINYFI